MAQPRSNSNRVLPAARTGNVSYWRVEGSLLELGAMRPVGFFTWNSQSFAERWARRAGMAGMALARPFAYFASRTFATRFLHTLLRGVSRDRLDLLGEEYFHYVLKPHISESSRSSRTAWNFEMARPRAGCSIRSCARADLWLGLPAAARTAASRAKNF